MRTKHRLYMWGGLLAGAVALGCQAPAVVPQGAGTPRAVVHFGAVTLEPDADMAIVLNRTDCGEKGYALKQVGPDPRVDHIKVEVTGPGLVDPYTKTITRDAFGGLCDATLNLAGLASGTYSVRFTSYNASGDPVAFANGTVNVANGSTSQLNLACNFNLGKLDVNIHCCDSGATPAPSVGPSVTPTPAPTPTPTPTPTPMPTPVPAPSGMVATGFSVDPYGAIYLMTNDYDGVLGSQLLGNRIVMVDQQIIPQQFVLVSNDVYGLSEGSYFGSVFKGLGNVTGGSEDLFSFDSAVRPVPAVSHTSLSPEAFFPGGYYYGNVTNPANGDFYFGAVNNYTIANSRFKILRRADTANVVYMDYTPPMAATKDDYLAPHTMAWAQDIGGPIWTSGRGVLSRQGTDPAAEPQTLVPGPAFGLVLPNDDSSEMFFTRFQPVWALDAGEIASRSIYWAKDDGAGGKTVKAVTTFDYGFPRFIEKGPDGYYVMLVRDAGIGSRFRIVKLVWDNSTPGQEALRPERVVVENFLPTDPASFPSPTP